MASKAQLKLGALPVINIAPYLNPNETKGRVSTSAALHSACLEFGFFYLDISTYIDPRETDELTKLAREFFELPQEEKDRISLKNEDGARGYARLNENVTNGKADNHEGIDFYRPVENADKTKPLWGENQWPGVSGFREKYETWVEKMKALGLIVMEAMSVGLGMTPEEWKDLRSQVDDSFWVLRVIGYPPLPPNHEDPTKSALQVFLRCTGNAVAPTDGDTSSLPTEAGAENGVWINADPIPGCIVCNIGEMWEIWTNGLYKSTLHRVVHKASNYRVSIPFFFEPNFDDHVKPLAAAARLQHRAEGENAKEDKKQKEYLPVVYGEFLKGKVDANFAGDEPKGKYN